jgi:hypothetical protein
MLRNIDAALGDPNLGSVTGWQGAEWWRNPTTMGHGVLDWIPNPAGMLPTSPSTHDTRERLAQLHGQAFLQAYQQLRGASAISDVEGQAATRAITRLQNLAQSDAGYLQALQDARREIWELMNLARQRAGQPTVPYVPYQPPTVGQGGNNTLVPDAEGWISLPDGTRVRVQQQQGR